MIMGAQWNPDGYADIESGLTQNIIVMTINPNEPIIQLNAVNILFDVSAL